jgi:hypothetical protein
MKTIYYVFFTFILISLAACEQVIDFNGKQPDDKIILNTIIGCDENYHSINLYKSAFLFSSNEMQRLTATVEIKVNNTLTAVENDGYGFYMFNADLQANDKIEISVFDNSLGNVKAESVVPEPPVILSVNSEYFLDFDSATYYMRTLITLRDKPDEKNYYRLLIKRTKTYHEEYEYSFEETEYFVNQDIVLSSLSREGKEDDNNLSRIFPDELFQGKEYTINVYFPLGQRYETRNEIIDVEIELQALTEPLYLYMRSLEQKWNSDVFDQPVKVYSNVSGGYGILGIYNSTKEHITVSRN